MKLDHRGIAVRNHSAARIYNVLLIRPRMRRLVAVPADDEREAMVVAENENSGWIAKNAEAATGRNP